MSSENDALPWLPPWLPQSANAGGGETDQREQAAAGDNSTQTPSATTQSGPVVSPQTPPPPQQHPWAVPQAPQQPPWQGPVAPQTQQTGVYPPQQVPDYSQHHQQAPIAPMSQQHSPLLPPGPPSPVFHDPRQTAAPSLDDVPLLRRAKKSPSTGWRKALFQLSGGHINAGQSTDEVLVNQLVDRVRQPARGDYRIAVLSLKGGVGKTTTTIALGSTFASLRGDRVVAVDANPDFGTLGHRIPKQTRSTVRHLLMDTNIHRYSDVRAHTSQSRSRLEVLASESDPATSEAFSEREYRSVIKILQRFYSIILTDCGTGLMHDAMAGVLGLTQTLVLVSAPAIDGARSAAATLDWLVEHGHERLVRNSVVVINSVRPDAPSVGMDQLQQYFLGRCRAVHVVPYDEHLATGAEIDLDALGKSTRRAYLELAASVADDFVNS